MSNNSKKPTNITRQTAVAFSAAMLAASVAPLANAAVNPFAANALAGGYGQVNMQNAGDATKSAEGACGNHDSKPQKCEGKCGEGKCGDEKLRKCEGKCGEGKCGAKDAGAKDTAAKKSDGEGKCGEGKCGGQ